MIKRIQNLCPYCTLPWNAWVWVESSFDGETAYKREICDCPVCTGIGERYKKVKI